MFRPGPPAPMAARISYRASLSPGHKAIVSEPFYRTEAGTGVHSPVLRANRTVLGPAGRMIDLWRWRPRVMKQKQRSKIKGRAAKSVLRLPDLEVAKSAVLSSLSCPDAQRGCRHAIDEFVEWYCSEPRLSFSKTVVVRYRMHLETRNLAPGTINLRLGAVRRLAYEAATVGSSAPIL